jgi:hypothetical protein
MRRSMHWAGAMGVVVVLLAGVGRVAAAEAAAGWSDRVPRLAGAAEHYVDPQGKSDNAGTRQAPWDLASALSGKQKVAPGDVVWVRGGVYRGKFEVRLAGTEQAPIHVRTCPGQRATILDCGMTVVEPAAYVWLWDLEIAGSIPVEKRQTRQTGSAPGDLPGSSGLEIRAGKGCKFVHLAIHDNVLGGVGWWVGSTDSEFHGCVIQDNGWRAPDRGHGHSIYTQNQTGTKTISNCIMSVPHDGSFTVHAYGSSRAYVDNFVIEENIVYNRGPFLVGGGRPSHHIQVLRNYLYGVNMQIGYGADNEDCEVRDNLIANGSLTIEKYRQAVNEGNVKELPRDKAVLIPSRYDPNRAHLAVYNGAKAAGVQVRVAPFLKPGDKFRVFDSKDLFGKPLVEGACAGEAITVPMNGPFAALVVRKGSAR